MDTANYGNDTLQHHQEIVVVRHILGVSFKVATLLVKDALTHPYVRGNIGVCCEHRIQFFIDPYKMLITIRDCKEKRLARVDVLLQKAQREPSPFTLIPQERTKMCFKQATFSQQWSLSIKQAS